MINSLAVARRAGIEVTAAMWVKPRKVAPEGVRLVSGSQEWPLDVLPEPEWDKKEKTWRWFAVLRENTVFDLEEPPKLSIHRLPAHTTVCFRFYAGPPT